MGIHGFKYKRDLATSKYKLGKLAMIGLVKEGDVLILFKDTTSMYNLMALNS